MRRSTEPIGLLESIPPNILKNHKETIVSVDYMFIHGLDDREFEEGGANVLYCDCNFPDAVVIWDKDGEILHQDGRYSMGNDGHRRTLTIKDTNKSDNGNYRAKLSSNGATTEAKVRIVSKITKPYSPPEQYRGTVEGYELDSTWAELKNTDRFNVKASGIKRELEIRDITPMDAGEYCCKTTDNKTYGRIRVEKFQIVKEIQDCEVGEKESAEFFLEISKPTRKINWLLDFFLIFFIGFQLALVVCPTIVNYLLEP